MLLPSDPTHAFMPYPAVAVPNAADGPLAGLTLGVKDIFDVAGYRTGCGSPTKLAQSEVKTTHNSAVAALLGAGARFVGKTHTEELAWSLYGTNVHFGTPVNPAAPDRIPGGSSSGSASAVAAGTCDIALGSDTGGSVRGPASFCGIYGLRPSHGAVGLDHCMPLAPSFDTCGWFARDAATLARVGAVLLPPDRATTARPLLAADLFARLAPEVRAALEPAIARVAARTGAPAPLSVYAEPVEPLYEAFRNVQAVEALAEHGAWVERYRPSLGPHIAPRITFARAVTSEAAAAGRALRARFAAHLHALLGTDGLLIAPTVPGPAPRLGGDAEEAEAYRYGAMLLLMPAGLAGLPQLVIPAGMVEGAPVGLSLIGPPGSDRALLSLAAAL
jgi:amidase